MMAATDGQEPEEHRWPFCLKNYLLIWSFNLKGDGERVSERAYFHPLAYSSMPDQPGLGQPEPRSQGLFRQGQRVAGTQELLPSPAVSEGMDQKGMGLNPRPLHGGTGVLRAPWPPCRAPTPTWVYEEWASTCGPSLLSVLPSSLPFLLLFLYCQFCWCITHTVEDTACTAQELV